MLCLSSYLLMPNYLINLVNPHYCPPIIGRKPHGQPIIHLILDAKAAQMFQNGSKRGIRSCPTLPFASTVTQLNVVDNPQEMAYLFLVRFILILLDVPWT